jgi:hypothetical protein
MNQVVHMPIFRERPGGTFKQGMATALQVQETSISILKIEPLELRRGGGGGGGGGGGAAAAAAAGVGAPPAAGASVDVGMWLRMGARETDRARVHVRGGDEEGEREAYSGRHGVAQKQGHRMRIEVKVAPLQRNIATLIAERLSRHRYFGSIYIYITCTLCILYIYILFYIYYISIKHTQHEDTTACVYIYIYIYIYIYTA